ncbi:hypothetical protein [Halomonas sp. BC2]|uniref:hypothetical protein n=1 Tax=Halomonas sp. BC2 TaxID=1670449 RepID=UPI0009BE91E5|nr:hypothetical protein [Halomonas sp. BC2]
MIRLGLLLLVLPILVLLSVYFWELGDVRACHLERGYWNYLESACRETPQPFVSWLERSPLLVNGGMLLSVVGLVMCMVGFYTKPR